MRVLITNNSLGIRAGTELYVRDLAVELLRRGHKPVAYSTTLGTVSKELRDAGVPVIDALASLGDPPDIIHGHHTYETLSAMIAFPQAPAISYCHRWTLWQEEALHFPRILRYVAVDLICLERLVAEGGIPSSKTRLILNFFDARRFPPRPVPLPKRPRTALAFSNWFSESTGLPILREACQRHGIDLDAVGVPTGNPIDDPGPLLAQYDLVFAVARCAIEALACGAAVILTSFGSLGPMVTTSNFAEVRPHNFGIRTTTEPLTVEALSAAINQYNAEDAAAVSRMVREQCELRPVVDQICGLYEEVIAEARATPLDTSANCDRAIVRYLEQSAPRFKKTEGDLVHNWAMRAYAAEDKVAELAQEIQALRKDRSQWASRVFAAGHTFSKISRARRNVPPMPVILGAPRSGTTLLRFMLDAHPDLAIPPETGFLIKAKAVQTREELFHLITHYPPQGPTWEDFGLSGEDLSGALEAIEPFEIAEGFRAFYRLYANAQNKRRYGDKTPLYCEHIETIRQTLPEARFIHIIRDGRDAALSLRPLWFSPGQDIRSLASLWKHLVKTARAAAGPDYLEIRYEDLLTNTEPVLREVCGFIDLPFDAAMLRYFERTPERLKQHVTRYDAEGKVVVTHEQRVQQDKLIMQPPQQERAGRWKEEMTVAEQSEFLAVAADVLRDLNYEV